MEKNPFEIIVNVCLCCQKAKELVNFFTSNYPPIYFIALLLFWEVSKSCSSLENNVTQIILLLKKPT